MNLRAVGRVLGTVLLLLAGFLLVPAAVALGYGELREVAAFLESAGAAAAAGGLLVLLNRGALSVEGRPTYFRREGLAVVGLTWFVAGVVGGLPYLLTGTFASPIDAFFESTSGFTTTGASVLSSQGIDGLTHGMAFWRSFTHWLGGFGIVLVFVVLFPTGGRSLFRSEVPGVTREASGQRVRDSALSLMRIYVGLTALELVLLLAVGMGAFDAVLHTFGTIATGGFSNHSASIAAFDSWRIELIVLVFMYLAGLNFAIYDTGLRVGLRPGWRRFVGSAEARLYTGLLVGSGLFVGLVLWFWGGSNGAGGSDLPDYRHFGRALLDSFFAVGTLQSCTGYATADFDRWPDVCRVLLMLVAAVGACAGSTGGGIKVVRFLIVLKAALRCVRRFIRPRAVHTIYADGQSLDEGTVAAVTSYFALWVLTLGLGTAVLTALDMDPLSACTAAIACVNNIGPGLGQVGPAMSFGELGSLAKLFLCLLMVLGRLEFFAVVALLVPSFWRT